MNLQTLIIPLSIAFALSAWLALRFTRPDSALHVLDHPNERSLHQVAVPRTGGVAILLALIMGGVTALFWVEFPALLGWVLMGLLLLGGVSYFEDRYGVKRRFRLLAHGLAALAAVAAGLTPESMRLADSVLNVPLALGLPLTLLFSVWMINLYNFMDGMDGFAGGMALIGFGALALAGWQHGHAAFTVANGLIAAAAAGFLTVNFPPARIFMGDAGSASLGFLAAVMSLWGAKLGALPLYAALLVFSPFIVDASVTLMRRLLRREKIWQAHRSHYYQRLVQLGWGHRKTVLWAYSLMFLCAASALRLRYLEAAECTLLLVMWAAIYAVIAYKVHLLERIGAGVYR